MVCAAIGAGLNDSDPQTALNIVGTMEGIIVLMKEPNTSGEMLQKLYPCYPGYREYISLSLNLTSGSILKWYRDLLSNFSMHEYKTTGYVELLQGLDDKTPGSLLFIPHFSGTCNPFFNPDARGLLYGLSLDTTMHDLTQGIIEGLCYELKMHLQGFEDAGIPIRRLKTVGGGAQSSKWLQLKANVTGLEIVNMDITEASAIGAAALCGTAVGVVDNPYEVIDRRGTREIRYTPSTEATKRFGERFLRYQALSKNIELFEAN